MESYSSDSCDSDTREQKTINLTFEQNDTQAIEKALIEIVNEKHNSEMYEIVHLYGNRMKTIPDQINRFQNLKILDVSNNCLSVLPDFLVNCPLTHLIARNNNLTNESLPKCLLKLSGTLRELNLSGNKLQNFPEQALDLISLRFLYLASNSIASVPKEIKRMQSLQLLALSSNQLTDVPENVGSLTTLNALWLDHNNIVHLPASIANLKHLKTLKLHQNKLKTLPIQIVKLKNLTELSLRDNPLVVRFIRDMTLQPPSLLELAARSIRLHQVHFKDGDIPKSLVYYLSSANCCVNPKCKGVFFDNRVEHIKFVDFCGMYRIPLLQYLCSSKCIVGDWESREIDTPPQPYLMRKVLLG